MIEFTRLAPADSEDVFVLGGGPSARGFDASSLPGLTIGANADAVYFDTDIMFSLCSDFPKKRDEMIREFVSRPSKRCVIAAPASRQNQLGAIPGVQYVRRVSNKGWIEDEDAVNGVHSGFGAVVLAAKLGAKRIHMIGIDMRHGEDGRTHNHDLYSGPRNPRSDSMFRRWANEFIALAPELERMGIEAINYVGEPESVVECFTKRPLRDLEAA